MDCDDNFDADAPPAFITAQKRACRELLRAWVAPDGTRPFAALSDTSCLIGQVSRIDFQKVAVLADAIDHIRLVPDAQIVILGEPHLKDAYGKEKARELAQRAADPAERRQREASAAMAMLGNYSGSPTSPTRRRPPPIPLEVLIAMEHNDEGRRDRYLPSK